MQGSYFRAFQYMCPLLCDLFQRVTPSFILSYEFLVLFTIVSDHGVGYLQPIVGSNPSEV